MAQCDQGYLCDVCGEEVEEIVESDLYLNFVLGRIPFEALSQSPERHLLCNPVQAQFIVHADFEPVVVEGAFDKRGLDPEYVAREEQIVTRAWLRLRELPTLGIPVTEYPLPRE